jgi:hypothetical protein
LQLSALQGSEKYYLPTFENFENFNGECIAENIDFQSFQSEFQAVSSESFSSENFENAPENIETIIENIPENIQNIQTENFEKTEEQIRNEVISMELDKLQQNMRNWYRRRNSTRPNYLKYEAGKAFLKGNGVEIEEVNDVAIKFIIRKIK